MKREEFAAVVESTIEEVIRLAEAKTRRTLPRKYAFLWLGGANLVVSDNVVEHIVQEVFVDEEHIYPCVYLGVFDILEDGSLLIVGDIAGYSPCSFGPNWMGRIGPFVHVVGLPFLYRIKGRDSTWSADGAFRYIVPGVTPEMWKKKPK